MPVHIKIFTIAVGVLLCLNTYSQPMPDSIYTKHYDSGECEERAFLLRKNLYTIYIKVFYEDGSLKEEKRFDERKGKRLVEYLYRPKERGQIKYIGIDYRRNGKPREETHADAEGNIMLHKFYNWKGRLKRTSTLIDKNRQLRLLQIYDRHGRVKKSGYTVPAGTGGRGYE